MYIGVGTLEGASKNMVEVTHVVVVVVVVVVLFITVMGN